MARRPKTMSADATVGDVRALLADDHVHMALLVRDDRLVGTVTSADLEPTNRGADPALTVSTLAGRTVAPETPVAPLRRRMIESGARRLAVVDRTGRLLGLLCLKRTATGFCTDHDIAARSSGPPMVQDDALVPTAYDAGTPLSTAPAS